ncbi:MAG: hypothetical protein ACE5F1_10850, partial [Planctomycetota bacterium]
CLVGACSNGRRGELRAGGEETLRRSGVFVDPGVQLELAAALLAADPLRVPGVGTPAPRLPPGLGAELSLVGDAVLRFILLESGAGIDPVWSPFIEGLASAEGAPADKNNNGTNRDEVLAELRERYVFRTNAELPEGLGPSFVLPGGLPLRLVRAPRNRQDAGGLRLPPVPEGRLQLSPGQLGSMILAGSRRAARLLSLGRGDLYGQTAEEGMLGLLLLESVLATERLLLGELLFDGQALGGIDNPQSYDPMKEPRIFPGSIGYVTAPPKDGLPARPEGWFTIDRSSSLLDQARLLRGFAELAWIASKQQSNNLLRRLFSGDPFGKRPESSGPNVPTPMPQGPVTWERNIKGLLQARCTPCHVKRKDSGFSVLSYDSVLAGGDHRATHPTVVKGKAMESLLWQVLALAKPPVSKRMPLGGPFFPPLLLDLVRDWIDQGALRKDPGGGSRPDPEPGLDGIRIVLKNLETLFAHPSGALIDRVSLGARGELCSADSAGAILEALAAAHELVPGLAERLLREQALFVARNLVTAEGEIRESLLVDRKELASAPAELGAAAAVVRGLFQAERRLGLSELFETAKRAADRLVQAYLGEDGRLRSFPDSVAAAVSPATLAELLEALGAYYARVPDPEVAARYSKVFERMKSAGIVLAEWPETGEVFGDGNPDSDRDGVVEVGTGLLPPLFAPLLSNGAAARGDGIPERRIHFSRDILPDLLVHCGSCHAGGARKGSFQLDTYVDLFLGGDSRGRMKSLVPGSPEQSLFYLKLERRNPPFGVQMPDGFPPLAPWLRARVRSWILAGAVRD